MKVLFILVRGDLPKTYRMVQGAHAVAAFALECPKSFREWMNGKIVFVRVRDLKELMFSILGDEPGAVFREPDLGREATAAAVYADENAFDGFPLA